MTKGHAYAYEAGYQDGIKEGLRRSDSMHEEYEERLKCTIDRCYELIRSLRASDGWPDDDKLETYGISPEVIGDY